MINQQVKLKSLTWYHVLSLQLFLVETWDLIPSKTQTGDLNQHFSKYLLIPFSFCHSLLGIFFSEMFPTLKCVPIVASTVSIMDPFRVNLHFSPWITYAFSHWFPIFFITLVFFLVIKLIKLNLLNSYNLFLTCLLIIYTVFVDLIWPS